MPAVRYLVDDVDAALLSFRAGESADALTVSALATQVFLDTYAPEGIRPDIAREVFAVCSQAAFGERLLARDRVFILAEQSGHLVGFGELSVGPALPVPGMELRGAELIRLYVQPAHQGHRIGAQLLQRAEAHSKAAGTGLMWLTAWAGNHRALAFYKAQGYLDTGATPYVFEGRSYENRVLVRRLPDAAAG